MWTLLSWLLSDGQSAGVTSATTYDCRNSGSDEPIRGAHQRFQNPLDQVDGLLLRRARAMLAARLPLAQAMSDLVSFGPGQE